MKKLIFVFLVPLFVFSCSTSDDGPTPNQLDESNSLRVLNYIKELGYPESSIKEYPVEYVVEGDIVFPKDMQVQDLEETSESGRTKHRYTTPLVSFARQNNIRVKIDQTMIDAPNYTTQIVGAIDHWNAGAWQRGARIKFVIVPANATEFDILIIRDNTLGDGALGFAQFPGAGGTPGHTVRINKALHESLGLTPLTRQATLLHEIGHAIGFRHTNQTNGTLVPGYEGTDSYSVMNAPSSNPLPSENDKGALAVLYPTELPYGIHNNGHYPWTFTWGLPGYTGFGAFVEFEVKHTRIDYQGNNHVSPVTVQTGTSYVLPFTQGQYSGQSATVSVRAKFASGTYSGWVTHNCTL
jgi:hypothetical protein